MSTEGGTPDETSHPIWHQILHPSAMTVYVFNQAF